MKRGQSVRGIVTLGSLVKAAKAWSPPRARPKPRRGSPLRRNASPPKDGFWWEPTDEERRVVYDCCLTLTSSPNDILGISQSVAKALDPATPDDDLDDLSVGRGYVRVKGAGYNLPVDLRNLVLRNPNTPWKTIKRTMDYYDDAWMHVIENPSLWMHNLTGNNAARFLNDASASLNDIYLKLHKRVDKMSLSYPTDRGRRVIEDPHSVEWLKQKEDRRSEAVYDVAETLRSRAPKRKVSGGYGAYEEADVAPDIDSAVRFLDVFAKVSLYEAFLADMGELDEPIDWTPYVKVVRMFLSTFEEIVRVAAPWAKEALL